MSRSRTAAVVTWAYAASFGLPVVPVLGFLRRHRRLPSFFGLFDMYAGPWSSRYSIERLRVLLLAFLGVTVLSALSGWLLWTRRKAGAVMNLALLPVEAVFWIGFALPLPWLSGVARAALLGKLLRAPHWSSR